MEKVIERWGKEIIHWSPTITFYNDYGEASYTWTSQSMKGMVVWHSEHVEVAEGMSNTPSAHAIFPSSSGVMAGDVIEIDSTFLRVDAVRTTGGVMRASLSECTLEPE